MKRGNQELMTRRNELPPASREWPVFPETTNIIVCLLALAAVLAAGCGAARPSKYYQLTVPGDVSHTADPNPLPITLLIGRLTAPALYREDLIVYSSSGES